MAKKEKAIINYIDKYLKGYCSKEQLACLTDDDKANFRISTRDEQHKGALEFWVKMPLSIAWGNHGTKDYRDAACQIDRRISEFCPGWERLRYWKIKHFLMKNENKVTMIFRFYENPSIVKYSLIDSFLNLYKCWKNVKFNMEKRINDIKQYFTPILGRNWRLTMLPRTGFEMHPYKVILRNCWVSPEFQDSKIKQDDNHLISVINTIRKVWDDVDIVYNRLGNLNYSSKNVGTSALIQFDKKITVEDLRTNVPTSMDSIPSWKNGKTTRRRE